MINFNVSKTACSRCGSCAAECPARIISMDNGFPGITPEKEALCFKCQHCLAVCPSAAISILGCDPHNSLPLTGNVVDSTAMELLIKGRRAVRQYKPEDLEPVVIRKLLEVACYAPTGRNSRQVRFTVVDNRAKMAEIRDEMMAKLVKISQGGGFPAGMEFFSSYMKLWEDGGIDFIFRGAPHFIIASAPKDTPTPAEDCVIALTTFELYAQTLGVGTVWDGLAKWVINDLLPEFKITLGIPEDHKIGYAMAFGKPALQYARTPQLQPAAIHFVE